MIHFGKLSPSPRLSKFDTSFSRCDARFDNISIWGDYKHQRFVAQQRKILESIFSAVTTARYDGLDLSSAGGWWIGYSQLSWCSSCPTYCVYFKTWIYSLIYESTTTRGLKLTAAQPTTHDPRPTTQDHVLTTVDMCMRSCGTVSWLVHGRYAKPWSSTVIIIVTNFDSTGEI